MRLRYFIICTLASFLLGGCGTQDAVLEQVKSEQINYVDSIYEVEAEEGSDIQPEVAVLEERCLQIEKLQEVLREKNITSETEISRVEGEEEEEETDIDWTQTDSVLDSYQVMGNTISGYVRIGAVEYKKKENMQSLLQAIEGVGITDLVSGWDSFLAQEEFEYDEESSAAVSLVRQGIQFLLEAGVREDNQGEKQMYSYLEIQVPMALAVVPPEYLDVLQTQVQDGFYPGSFTVGGYMDMLHLISSYNEPGNPYNKTVSYYLKDGIPIQIEIELEENGQSGTKVFSEQETETLTNLITQISKDAVAAGEFVESFTISQGKSGSIGSCEWKLKRKGDYYILTIQ